MKNIGYHTRLISDNTKKICGGSFGGEVSIETANRLVNAMFSVVVTPSGTARFVDREGREVSLYMSVDPSATDKGKVAMAKYHADKKIKDAVEEARCKDNQDTIESLMEGLSDEEIIARLS